LRATQPRKLCEEAKHEDPQGILRNVIFAAVSMAVPSVLAQAGAHTIVTPGDLRWIDVPSLPYGANLVLVEGPLNEAVSFTFRLRFPADYKLPAHWHAAIEHVTVISGAFNMGIGAKLDTGKTKPLLAGSIAIMQPKTNHFAWIKEETIVQVHGIGPWIDPRRK
jgi:anti-sigma factor ChrR (cupin superfamily)